MLRLLLGRIAPLVCSLGLLCYGCGGSSGTITIFELQIENISSEDALTASDGSAVVIAFSPTVWTTHQLPKPIFSIGAPAPANGLEQMAEDADSSMLIDSLQRTGGVNLVGLVQTTVDEETILTPGQTYRFQISAGQGDRLSIVSTFLQANDLFLGFNDVGIPLFNSAGVPLSGDITSEVFLYDAGTEVNQEPGLGPDQVIRQTEPGQGAAEDGVVRLAGDDGFTLPAISSMVRITINQTRVVELD